MTEDIQTNPKLGDKTVEGVYAGLTPDGKQQIYAMPTDIKSKFLKKLMTFNKAAKRVVRLNAANAFGHNDWQIGSREVMHVLQKNHNKGSLKGTFDHTNKISGFVYPVWYWSSTGPRHASSHVVNVRFSNGNESWDNKRNIRLSCRPVRLVSVPVP